MSRRIQKKPPATPLFRRKWMIPIYCAAAIMIAIVFIILSISTPHFFIDHKFDAVIWRTQINERPKMIDELLDDLEGKNYSREHLLEMLGQPNSGNDPEHRLTWSLADCEFSFRHCLCYLYITLEDDHLVGARKVCD